MYSRGVLACSSKWIQRVLSGDGHEPAEGSDLTTFYFGDKLAERDIGIGRLEPQTSLRQCSCGTQAARRSSAARNSTTQIGRFDYSEWTSSSGRGLYAVPLDRHGGTVEDDRCLWLLGAIHLHSYYTLHITILYTLLRKGGGRKWAVLQHWRCIGYLYWFYLVVNVLFHFLYYSILLYTYFLD